MDLGDITGGNILEAGVDLYNAKQANKTMKKSAREQMRFQERMSSTAHQREVKDLIAAGLNPVLSANSGASSPSGAGYSADFPSMQGVLSRSISSAREYAKTSPEVEALKGSAEASKASAAAQREAAASTKYQREVVGPKNIEEIDSRIKANNANAARQVAETDMVGRGWFGRIFGDAGNWLQDKLREEVPEVVTDLENTLNNARGSAKSIGKENRTSIEHGIEEFGRALRKWYNNERRSGDARR